MSLPLALVVFFMSPADGGSSTQVDQIGGRARPVVSAPRSPPPSADTQQVGHASTRVDQAPITPTAEGPVRQVTRGPPNANAPSGPAPVAPRSTALARVEGADVCQEERGRREAICENTVEQRADEFAPPEEAPPPPEATLLAGLAEANSATSTARRVAQGQVGEDDAAAAAALELTRPLRDEDELPSAQAAQTDAAVAAVMQYLLGAPYTPR